MRGELKQEFSFTPMPEEVKQDPGRNRWVVRNLSEELHDRLVDNDWVYYAKRFVKMGGLRKIQDVLQEDPDLLQDLDKCLCFWLKN